MAGGLPKYQLDRADLVAHLRRQISFLERSARAFDEGAEDEAVRLATILRVLLHDSRGPSTSLLTHLGVKDKLSYVDTADPIDPRNLAPTLGLLIMEMTGSGTSYVAPLGEMSPDRKKPNRPFKRWWEDPVTKDARGNFFSRKDYVLNASNTEGGAHVDHALDAAYAVLTKDNSLGWVQGVDDGPEKPLDRNPAFASVRQIAYEVDQTLHQHPLKLGPDYLTPGLGARHNSIS